MIEIYPQTIYYEPDTPYTERQKDDCSIIAVAALAEIPYDAAARVLRACGKQDDDGATDKQIIVALTNLGCEVFRVRTIRRTIRTVCRSLPVTGRYLITTSDHAASRINGELIHWDKWGDLLRVEYVYKVDFS